jgi:Domain of unknown function (DUF4148)
MKSLIKSALISCALAAPTLAFAQASTTQAGNGPLTRAQVRANLVRIVEAGYRPTANDPHYPSNIQAAQAKLAAPNHDDALASTSVGGAGARSAGGRADANGAEPPAFKNIYFGH